MAITVGCRGRADAQVSKELTALAAGSGSLLVLGTPFMIALMEQAACNAIAPHLEEGQTSVGTRLDVSHDSATPVGMDIWAEAEITAVEARQLSYTVTAWDERGVIGSGTHQRVLIRSESFLQKTYDKL